MGKPCAIGERGTECRVPVLCGTELRDLGAWGGGAAQKTLRRGLGLWTTVQCPPSEARTPVVVFPPGLVESGGSLEVLVVVRSEELPTPQSTPITDAGSPLRDLPARCLLPSPTPGTSPDFRRPCLPWFVLQVLCLRAYGGRVQGAEAQVWY